MQSSQGQTIFLGFLRCYLFFICTNYKCLASSVYLDSCLDFREDFVLCIERCTMGSTKAFLKSHCSFFIPIFHLKGCNRKYAKYTRGDIGGKTRKTVVLPGFFKIECGGGSGNVWPCIYVLGSYLAWTCALQRWHQTSRRFSGCLFDVTKSSNAERSRDELTENSMIINVCQGL